MKIKQIISLLLTTAILAQNIAIAHNSWGNHNKDSHNESYIEQHNSDRIDEIRDFPKERHERFDFNKANQNNNTNHRKIIDPKVEKYSMKAPEENEVRVIATYKSKDSKTSFESINYNNTPSKMRNLSEKHVALNINRNTLSNIITNDNIEFVESDYIIYKSNNETTSNSYNADVSVLIGNYYPDSFNMIKVDKYHNIGNYGDGIRIAIFDTGLNPKSTELNINGGAVFVDGCESFADDNGHGTAMAGIIGAAMDNEGLSGIAPNAELYSVKVLNSDGIGYTSGVIEGITWAIENDIDIIYFGFTSDQYSRTLEETVNYASENGIIMVAPAGNDSTQNICYPAGYENVISVGSVDKFGNISDFSNYATTVDVYAPGENIDSILYINNKPTPLSGTSVSAAHVAGISALLLNENKNNTTDDILEYLTNTQESGFVVSDYTILDSSILPKVVNLQTPEDILAISAANAELMTSSITTSKGIALNQIYTKTFDSLGEKHRYAVILPNYNQTVTFKILSSNVDYDIYYEDHYNGLTYKVTDQALVLQSGFNNFYVYCEGSGSGEYEYDLLVTSTPYDNTISEIYAGYGVDETTGNFSYGFDDLKSSVAGKDFVIQRRYNSRDFTDNHFNPGWTLNFEGKADYSKTIYIDKNQDEIEVVNENIISITIPDGSVLHFEKIVSDSVCVFQPRNSRAQMDCNESLNGDIVITMPDQTKYYYYSIEDPETDDVEHHSSGCLYKIVDKFGNTTNITLEDGKITEITDISGNKYFFGYNDGNLTSISDNFGRIVTYSYSENKLVQSTDSNGIKYYYTYGTDGLLTEIKNAENAIIMAVTYGNNDGYRYKVNTITDKYGTIYEYGYDTINYKTTKTELPLDENLTPKSTTTGYDIERDVTYFVDEDGRQSSTKFFYQELIEETEINPDDEPGAVINDFYCKWKNGEIVDYTDASGAKTHYDYLNPLYDKLGLPISKTVTGALITNESEPELLEYVEYEYDNFGNIILEKKWIDKPDTGIGTYKAIRYIYDDSGRYLLKKAEYLPVLNTTSIPEFSTSNINKFAVTSYEYNTDHVIKGLISKIVYPEQYTGSSTDKGWEYEYDSNGNCISVINPESTADNVIKETYEYNNFGWVSKHISGEGNITEYEYDNNGNEIKKTVNINEVYRTLYNSLGLPIQIIAPNQYDSSCENSDGTYDNNSVGTRYEYSTNGLLTKETDTDGYITQYSYDRYGNVFLKIMPNGSSYQYKYDKLDNLTDTYYRNHLSNAWNCIKQDRYSASSGRISISTCNNYDYDSMVAGHYKTYNAYGKLLEAHDIMRYDDTAYFSAKYDLIGNPIYEENLQDNDKWNVTYYKTNLYDNSSSRIYQEKYVGNECYDISCDDMNLMFDNLTYRYEKVVYDKNGNVISTITSTEAESSTPSLNAAETVTETTEYYADNLVKSVTDSLGVKTEYEYDNDRVVSKVTVTVPGKEPTVVVYENNHHGKPITVKTYLGPERIVDNTNLLEDSYGYYTLITNTYDKNGNLKKQIPSVGAITEFTYNNRNLQTSVTTSTTGENASSMTESYVYDDMGNVTEQVDKNGNVTKFVYNQLGHLTYTIHPNNRTTFTVYDTHGRLLTEVDAVDYTGSVSLTNASLDEYTTDYANIQNMNRTVYTYDQDDNVLTATKYTYDSDTETWNSVVKATNTYDRQKRLLTTTDALGNTAEYQYDVFGNRIKYIDPTKSNTAGYTMAYEYDMLGRKTKESNSYGDYYSYAYDKKGNLTGVQLTSDGVTETISSYTYDEAGKTLTQTDGNGHTTTLVYDDNNFLANQYAHGGENDSTKTDSYKFDSRGNLAEHTDRNGNTTVYTYDDFNRLALTVSGDESIAYTYDNNGNVLTMTDSTGVTTYTYDSMGRILTQNHSVTGTVSYSYDNYTDIPYGFVSETTTDPKGHTVEKWYDSDDKIYKVVDNSDITRYNYYDNDKLESVLNPNGCTATYTYDAEGNLLTLVNAKSDGTVVDSFTYTYSDDTLGYKNQVSKTETLNGEFVGTTTYEYDIQSRLTKVTTPDGVQNVYTYDDAGNRLTKTSTVDGISAVTEYTYDEQNRLLQTKAYVVGDTTEVYTYFGYDNNGNQIAKWTQTIGTTGTADSVTLSELGVNANDDTALYEFDNFNRLVSIYQGDTTIENTYRGDGKNISRTTDGEITYYVYDGNTVILELDSYNEETARNVYGRNLITRETPDNKVVYGYNGHGDVVNYTNISGQVLQLYAYDEFGNVVLDSYIGIIRPFLDLDQAEDGKEPFFPELRLTQIDNPYRYAGYEYIEDVELYDLNARYYNPEIARFLSADPYYNLGNRVIGLYEINTPNVISIMQANNIFAYCGNNPIYFIDNTGIFWDIVWDVVSFGISVADVISNPTDPWAWAGLVGDAVDFIPFLTGIGEGIKLFGNSSKAGKAITKLTKVADYKKTGVWMMNAFDRGYEIERRLGGMANNFPKIDKYVKAGTENGVSLLSEVTSIKSIDLSSPSYISGSNLKNKLMSYVKDLDGFSHAKYKGESFELIDGAKKTLHIAIPPVEINSDQAKAFAEIIEEADKKKIKVIIDMIE